MQTLCTASFTFNQFKLNSKCLSDALTENKRQQRIDRGPADTTRAVSAALSVAQNERTTGYISVDALRNTASQQFGA